VVNLASSMHRVATEGFNFDDIMSEKQYSLFGTYGQSKLANILFTKELDRR
jgi:retinol dehydrogenase 12